MSTNIHTYANVSSLGFVDEAAKYFHKVLRLDPSDVMARENLDNLYSNLVDRWHFRMLNDHTRNAAYYLAIQRVVKSGYERVLDIGAGTALLRLALPARLNHKKFFCL